MKRLPALLLLMALASFAKAQVPIPYDSAELCWPELQYAAGGSLADPSGVSVIIEVSAPGGNGWGPIAVVHDVTCWRVDNLADGLWSFRLKLVTNGAVFGPPTAPVSKLVKTPPQPPWVPPVAVVGLVIK